MKSIHLLFLLLLPVLAISQTSEISILGEWVLKKEFSTATGLVESSSTQAVEFSSVGQANYNYAGTRFSFPWQRAGSSVTVGKSQYRIQLIDESVLILESQDGTLAGTTYAYQRKETAHEKSPVIETYFSGLHALPAPEEPAPRPTGSEKKNSLTQSQNPQIYGEDHIFKVADEQPSFPGCELIDDEDERKICADKKLLQFIYHYLQYPDEAKSQKIEGMVVITFVIEKDGSVTNAKIVRDIGGGCGPEAMRVVNLMPKWNPGRQSGKPVRIQFNLPIKFAIN